MAWFAKFPGTNIYKSYDSLTELIIGRVGGFIVFILSLLLIHWLANL